jgi:hypothetical protein
MAGLLDAIIVPFAAVGMFESLQIILDRNDLMTVPFVSERYHKFAATAPTARAGDKNESFIFPVVAPNFPSRNYFLFMKVCFYTILYIYIDILTILCYSPLILVVMILLIKQNVNSSMKKSNRHFKEPLIVFDNIKN